MEHAHDADRAALARTIMRRQARIGLRVAVGFLVVLLGLPLLNLFYPDLMAARIGGFTLAWLLLGVLVYPFMWLMSWLFVRGSDRIEEEIVREFGSVVGRGASAPSAPPSGLPTTENPQPARRKLFVEEDES